MPPKSIALLALALLASIASAAGSGPDAAKSHPRARDLGVPFDGTPGPLNAITDVNGVEVGYKTLISGDGKLVIGKGPVRTGVTAILPRGKSGKSPTMTEPYSRPRSPVLKGANLAP